MIIISVDVVDRLIIIIVAEVILILGRGTIFVVEIILHTRTGEIIEEIEDTAETVAEKGAVAVIERDDNQ